MCYIKLVVSAHTCDYNTKPTDVKRKTALRIILIFGCNESAKSLQYAILCYTVVHTHVVIFGRSNNILLGMLLVWLSVVLFFSTCILLNGIIFICSINFFSHNLLKLYGYIMATVTNCWALFALRL